MTVGPLSRAPDSPPPSLAELLDRLATDASLTPRQRQQTCSALRTVGRASGRRLQEIQANPRQLRERLVPFGRYCGDVLMHPYEITDAVATSLPAALENDSLSRNPRQVHRTM